MSLSENTFFDINQLPQEEGLLMFGISMNRIGNSQSAENNFKYLQDLDKKILKTEGIGLSFVYADYLYFNSSQPAFILKNKHINLMTDHKHAFLSEIAKDSAWIKKSFSFYTFGQASLDNSEIYKKAYQQTLDLYNTDIKFKEYVTFDARLAGKAEEEEEEELGAMFILEEITLFYLFAKGLIKTNNEFVKNPVWQLQCYPGKPLKSEVYLFQLNPLKLSNAKNKHENCFYDLESKSLYDYTRLNIDTFDF